MPSSTTIPAQTLPSGPRVSYAISPRSAVAYDCITLRPRSAIAARSAGGRYSAPTPAFFRHEMSTLSSAAFSTISLRNDGVPM